MRTDIPSSEEHRGAQVYRKAQTNYTRVRERSTSPSRPLACVATLKRPKKTCSRLLEDMQSLRRFASTTVVANWSREQA